jgi:REP-associated tyrosine transposase
MFSRPDDYELLHKWLSEACVRYDCLVHAYVLMTNHMHLLITPRLAGAIGKVMQSVGRRYVQYFNRLTRCTGTLWEGRYRATLIDSEAYLFTCYRYIELNPVRAGLTLHPANYRWSSHGANALGRPDPLITPHELYHALGRNHHERRRAYRALFRVAIDEPVVAEIREATNRAWALGPEQFHRSIGPLIARRSRPLPRGGHRLESARPHDLHPA